MKVTLTIENGKPQLTIETESDVEWMALREWSRLYEESKDSEEARALLLVKRTAVEQ